MRRFPTRQAISAFWSIVLTFCIFGLVTGGLWVGDCVKRASDVVPAPLRDPSFGSPLSESEGSLSGRIDWGYWIDANPDTAAWVEVPDTCISTPVVQASENEPEAYLARDIFGEDNVFGCPYFDAEYGLGCLEGGVSFVFGHNMGWGSRMVFADFSRFLEERFARDHSAISFATPGGDKTLRVVAVDCVNGSVPMAVPKGKSSAEVSEWLWERVEEADVRLVEEEELLDQGVVVFVTCSYNRWANERTLVYAAFGSSA